MLTAEERLITQDRIVDDRLDPFKNGCFRPVVVPDSVSIDSNPNALSDVEIRSVFISSDLAWAERTATTTPSSSAADVDADPARERKWQHAKKGSTQ
jgi:hypothetical protein